MIKHGKAPFLECSSRGDKRFSAFYARVNGASIEDAYQGAKIFKEGDQIFTGLSWREAKGKKAINQENVSKFYDQLWKQYLVENPHLINVLKEASGLSDMFGQKGHVCQATALWKLRSEFIAKEEAVVSKA